MNKSSTAQLLNVRPERQTALTTFEQMLTPLRCGMHAMRARVGRTCLYAARVACARRGEGWPVVAFALGLHDAMNERSRRTHATVNSQLLGDAASGRRREVRHEVPGRAGVSAAF
eukprot:6205664-Pleurochrysis_carterae.AAC.1